MPHASRQDVLTWAGSTSDWKRYSFFFLYFIFQPASEVSQYQGKMTPPQDPETLEKTPLLRTDAKRATLRPRFKPVALTVCLLVLGISYLFLYFEPAFSRSCSRVFTISPPTPSRRDEHACDAPVLIASASPPRPQQAFFTTSMTPSPTSPSSAPAHLRGVNAA